MDEYYIINDTIVASRLDPLEYYECKTVDQAWQLLDRLNQMGEAYHYWTG